MRTRPSHTLNTALKNLRATITGVAGTLVPLEDEATHTITAISYVVDIDERRRREDAVIDKSRRDGLTGCSTATPCSSSLPPHSKA